MAFLNPVTSLRFRVSPCIRGDVSRMTISLKLLHIRSRFMFSRSFSENPASYIVKMDERGTSWVAVLVHRL